MDDAVAIPHRFRPRKHLKNQKYLSFTMRTGSENNRHERLKISPERLGTPKRDRPG